MSLLSRLRLVSLLSCSVGLLPATASAQQAMELPGIYIQGATLETSRPAKRTEPAQAAPAKEAEPDPDEAGTPQEQVGSAVSVVTAKDLERQQVRTAHDALRGLPGVSVSQQGTSGALTVVRIRGAESRHTLVVIDGVEVNSGADGFFDFSNLSAADIERIEVLRGPQGGLYGNSAIGGVVSITTKSGRGPLALSLKAEAGTQHTGSLTAQLAGGNQTAWGSVVVHGSSTAGFNISALGTEDDATRIRSFAARGGIALSPALRIEGTLREHNTFAEYDVGFAQLYKGFFAPADAPFTSDARLRVGSLQATLDTFSKQWVHTFYLQGAETVREDFAPTFSDTISRNSKFGYKSTLEIDGGNLPFRHYLTAMLERRTETFEQPVFSATEFSRDRNSIAGEIRGEYFKSLFLAGTLRHDQNNTTDDYTTWHLSGSYLVPGKVFRVHASVGTGVKYPSFGDLHGFFLGFTPNPDLVPEESIGYDFGIETKLLGGRAVVDVTYFNADLTNEIALACPPPTFICSPFNRAGESTRKGIEVAARYALTPEITLGASYTFLNAREDTGLEEVRRPRNSGRLDANYAFLKGRGNFNFAAIYNGDMKDLVTDAGFVDQRTTLDDYWLLRATASYKLQPGLEVFGRVENLLDQHYQEVFGYNATPGVAAFAGIKLTFGGADGYRGN